MATNEYDAIVMDLRLPDKHGLVVLRDMRGRDDRTPVLLLTAQGALQDRVRGLNLGADDFLTKPFALEELEARVAALVRRSRGRQFPRRSEEHTSELQSLMRTSYAVVCLKK